MSPTFRDLWKFFSSPGPYLAPFLPIFANSSSKNWKISKYVYHRIEFVNLWLDMYICSTVLYVISRYWFTIYPLVANLDSCLIHLSPLPLRLHYIVAVWALKHKGDKDKVGAVISLRSLDLTYRNHIDNRLSALW